MDRSNVLRGGDDTRTEVYYRDDRRHVREATLQGLLKIGVPNAPGTVT
jgi:hypothetical protein